MGFVELHVNELAKESEDNHEYPYESLGRKTATDPIRLEGNQYKGQLHYVAEFVPALAIRGVKFESGPNELQQAVEADASDAGETVDSGSADALDEVQIPEIVTAKHPLGESEEPEPAHKGHTKGAKSTDTTNTALTTDTTHTEANGATEAAGVAMARDTLLKQRPNLSCCIIAALTDFYTSMQNLGLSFSMSFRDNCRGKEGSRSSWMMDIGLLSAPRRHEVPTPSGNMSAKALSKNSTSVVYGFG